MRARGTRTAVGAAVGLVAWMLLTGGGARPASAQGSGGTFSLPIIDNARMWPIVGGLPTLDFDRGSPVREQTAVVARQYWRDLGADVELRVSEFNALLSRIRARPNPLQAWVLWYITPPEADLLAYYHSQGTLNEFSYSSPEVDQLLEKGRATFDQKERARLYQQAQKLLAADAPVVYLVYPAESRR